LLILWEWNGKPRLVGSKLLTLYWARTEFELPRQPQGCAGLCPGTPLATDVQLISARAPVQIATATLQNSRGSGFIGAKSLIILGIKGQREYRVERHHEL
jgi:hypothetical protein